MSEIAVFVNNDDKISDFFNSHKIKVFEKDNNWIIKKEIILEEEKLENINGIRRYFIHLVESLGSCRSVIVKKATGIPYNIFSMYDYSVWELDGDYAEHLDNVYIKELEVEHKCEEKNEIDQIYKIVSEGHYFMDLIELQLTKPELSSKKAIRPFLKNNSFEKLEIRCCHPPVWIEKEANNSNLKININKISKNEYILIILR